MSCSSSLRSSCNSTATFASTSTESKWRVYPLLGSFSSECGRSEAIPPYPMSKITQDIEELR
eukprot:1018263-Pyramimonas_sp.AAC.1